MPISKVVYGNQVVIDITDTTATPSDVMYGKYFYMPDGSRVEGTGSGGGGVVVVETTDEHGGTIVDITGEVIRLQTKTATPSTSQQTILPDSGYIGLSSVTISAMPSFVDGDDLGYGSASAIVGSALVGTAVVG